MKMDPKFDRNHHTISWYNFYLETDLNSYLKFEAIIVNVCLFLTGFPELNCPTCRSRAICPSLFDSFTGPEDIKTPVTCGFMHLL